MRRLRIAARLVALVAWLGISIAGFFILRVFAHRNPMPRAFLSGVARIVGARVKTVGKVIGPRTILLSNHVSWLDIPVLASQTGTAFVAHDGLAGNALLKWLCEMNNTVFIARSRRSTVPRQVKQVRAGLNKTPLLTIFPEGTTGNGHSLLPLKSALLSAVDPNREDVAVQPALISYGKDNRDIAWVGDEPGLDNFFRILARSRPLTVTLHLLPPLAGKELLDRKAIALATREALEKTLATI